MGVNSQVRTSSLSALLSKAVSSKLIMTVSFALLTAIAAQISVPVKPVPFTLQTMMVVLAGAFLGRKYGMYSQILYLALGASGLPVFASSADGLYGIAKLFGPTGGYLLAFPLAAFVTGLLIEKSKSYIPVVLSMFLGNVIIIAVGTLFLHTFYIKDFSQALAGGAAIFSLWTVIKVAASAAIYFGISKKN